MNAERLNVVVKALRQELNSTRIAEILKGLASALQNLSNQPGNGTYQQQVSAQLLELTSAGETADSNHFSPAWREVVEEIGAEGLIGSSLAERVRQIFERNQITPANALQEIGEIDQALTDFKNGIDQASVGLSLLRIGMEELQPGESEVGISIPRPAVDNELAEFADELAELKFILATFVEFTTGKTPSLPLRTISSSDLQIYIAMVPAAAAALAKAADWLIDAYKKILDIRKARAELRKGGVPEHALKGIEEYANNAMNERIESIVIDLEKEYFVVKDGGRKSELRNALRLSLNKLANRIDKGYNIQIRIEEPAEEQEDAAMKDAVTIIRRVGPSLQFKRLEGDPILALPEVQEAKKDDKKTSKKEAP